MIIGRIHSSVPQPTFEHFLTVRTSQVAVAESDGFSDWIDTDDISLLDDSLHFDAAGQLALGQRFAEQLIQNFDPRQPGDANGDGKVTFADFAIFQNNFNMPGSFAQGDFNEDGIVGFADFAILQNHFDHGSMGNLEDLILGSNIPELNMATLVTISGLGLITRRPHPTKRRVCSHGLGDQPSNRCTTSVSFWPPKPKLLDSATSTLAERD